MRINRLRRAQPSNRLTDAQHETLMFGQPILNYRPHELFTGTEHARRAWSQFRSEFMTGDYGGQRPWGFYKFDLQCDPVPHEWHEELAILESRGLLTREEELRVEKVRRCLDPEQSESLYSLKYFPIHIAQMVGGDNYVVRKKAAEFALAAGWHERRKRPALAEKYRKLAAMIEDMLHGRPQEAIPTPGRIQ